MGSTCLGIIPKKQFFYCFPKGDVSRPIRRLLARLAIAVPGWKIQPSASMMTGVTILIKMLINLAMVMVNIAVAR